MTWFEVVGSGVALMGVVLSLLAAWGVIDFPSPLSRMHAATKSASLGVASIAVGAGLAAGSPALIGVGSMVAVFMFVTAPISGHLLGRAAYLAGDVSKLIRDDYAGVSMTEPHRSDASNVFSPTRFAALVVVWVVLWRDPGFGNWVGGVLVASLVETAVRSRRLRVRPAGVIPFLVAYFGLILRSNLRVAWEVLTPSNEAIREAVVAVPLESSSRSATLLVANAVSFTPGTLSVDLVGHTLYVHVLQFESHEAVTAEVRKVELLASRLLPAIDHAP